MWSELLLFASILALAQFSPGPDMLLLTRTSLAEGRKAGWMTMLGIVTGLSLHATVAITGMSVVLSRGGWVTSVLKLLAGSYLIWLGTGLLRQTASSRKARVLEEAPTVSATRYGWYLRGLLCNVLNPKVVIFFAGMAAEFLSGDNPSWWPLVLWVTLVGEGIVLWGLWVAVLQWSPIRHAYDRASRWLDGVFGLGLAVLGLLLLLGIRG